MPSPAPTESDPFIDDEAQAVADEAGLEPATEIDTEIGTETDIDPDSVLVPDHDLDHDQKEMNHQS